MFCTGCIRDQHARLPFHRVEQWTGEFFEASWLCRAGVMIHLGHGGSKCPIDAPTINEESRPSSLFQTSQSEDEWEADDSDDDADVRLSEFPPVGDMYDSKGRSLMIIVDRSGLHSMAVCECHCPNAQTLDIQLFDMGLFPASYTRIRTIFTFKVLDDFLLDNLECKTSCLNYFTKLRRVTCSAFPHTVPVRWILCHTTDSTYLSAGSLSGTTPS